MMPNICRPLSPCLVAQIPGGDPRTPVQHLQVILPMSGFSNPGWRPQDTCTTSAGHSLRVWRLKSWVETPGHLYNICRSFSLFLEAQIPGGDPRTPVQHLQVTLPMSGGSNPPWRPQEICTTSAGHSPHVWWLKSRVETPGHRYIKLFQM